MQTLDANLAIRYVNLPDHLGVSYDWRTRTLTVRERGPGEPLLEMESSPNPPRPERAPVRNAVLSPERARAIAGGDRYV